MALRYRNYYLRNAVTLGGLAALFLLVRCSVPERDYSKLGIAGDNGVLHGAAGQGGLDGEGGASGQGNQAGQGGLDGLGGDEGGVGGQGGAPPAPVPCILTSNDAGTDDAGTDAGIEGTGTEQDAGNPYGLDCECVDGFLRGVDGDGDGDRSRACVLAPGLDCDDGDGTVTHNSCGGCAALTETVGNDCLDCGAFTCDGPDSVVCATKPGTVLIDPDCRCLDALIVARDTDGDGAGTRLCEQNPGLDCNDGDNSYTSNACGGCAELPGVVGAGCNECGVYTCSGTSLVCLPTTVNGGRQCLDTTTRQTCINDGFWGSNFACPNVCYQGNCETCIPGTYRCIDYSTGDQIQKCYPNALITSSSTGIGWSSYISCTTTQTCNSANGTCTGYLLLPRDHSFDVVPLLRPNLPWHELMNTADDSDYG